MSNHPRDRERAARARLAQLVRELAAEHGVATTVGWLIEDASRLVRSVLGRQAAARRLADEVADEARRVAELGP